MRGRLAVILCGLLLLVACQDSERKNQELLSGILEQRARHIKASLRREIVRAVIRAATESGVDSLLLVSVIEQESHFKPRAKSHRGALGLMQIRPATAREVAGRIDISMRNESVLYDPAVNVRIGAAYLAELRERFGSWDLALTAYSHGPTRARQLRNRQPSSRYASRVLRRLDLLRREYRAASDLRRAD